MTSATIPGGGVLDLIVTVLGGGRADALRWAADLAGVPMDNTSLSAEDRRRWTEERRTIERHISAFFDPTAEDRPSSQELQDVTRLLERLKRMGDTALVNEYRDWATKCPHMTEAMVHWARNRERIERAALERYLRGAA